MSASHGEGKPSPRTPLRSASRKVRFGSGEALLGGGSGGEGKPSPGTLLGALRAK